MSIADRTFCRKVAPIKLLFLPLIFSFEKVRMLPEREGCVDGKKTESPRRVWRGAQKRSEAPPRTRGSGKHLAAERCGPRRGQVVDFGVRAKRSTPSRALTLPSGLTRCLISFARLLISN